MKRKFLIFLAVLCLSICIPHSAIRNAEAAGTVTQSLEVLPNIWGPKAYVLTLSWTADAAAATVPDTSTTDDITNQIKGLFLYMVVTNPGAVAPTDNYDITIEDTDGIDIMGGALQNRDQTNTEQAMPFVGASYAPRPIGGTLTLKISGNSVNSATGTVKLYLIR